VAKPKAKEFAPGIPTGRKIQPIPEVKRPKTWEFGVQKHTGEKAKEHFDLRLGDPSGKAHSWALKYLPKPGERRLAVQQPTHTVEYMDFKGVIPEGYGAGPVDIARRDKAEVVHASDRIVRFNVYAGKEVEEYALRRTRGKNWLLQNVTTSRKAGPGKLLPSSKPKYKNVDPDKIDTDDPDTELQAKIDGAHVLYQFKSPGTTPKVVSYRPTERATGVIEHTQKLPGFHKRETPKGLQNTILRGELYARGKDGKALPAARVGGLLNAGVWKSREKQKAEGKLIPVVFDITHFKGKNVENEPYGIKKKLIAAAMRLAPWLKRPRTATTPVQKRRLLEDIRTGKEPSTDEGVVEWHKDKPVPRKGKFLEERDVYIRSIYAEAGVKRKGTMAGGFEFSDTKTGPVVGRCGTGMSHAMKKDMLENPSKYQGMRTRIKHHRAPSKYAPRVAKFHSFHLDEDIPEDVKTAALGTNSKGYRLQGKVTVQGIPVDIENRKGSVREGKNEDGSTWRTKFKIPYGYIRGTKGADGEEVDAYVGPDKDAPKAYVVKQKKDDGSYDEDTVMLGFKSKAKARKGILQHYDDPKYIGATKTVPIDKLKRELKVKEEPKEKAAQSPHTFKGKPASADSIKKTVDFQGITVRVDRPKGFVMRGTDDQGQPWTRKYKYDYGYIPRTLGGDDDGLDVFIGPERKAEEAYWAVQNKADGSFDEYKVFLGFPNRDAAIGAYKDHIPKKFFSGLVTMKVDMMRAMLRISPKGGTKKLAMWVGYHDELDKIAETDEWLKTAQEPPKPPKPESAPDLAQRIRNFLARYKKQGTRGRILSDVQKVVEEQVTP
jgi:inorganic pyrophosphatase